MRIDEHGERTMVAEVDRPASAQVGPDGLYAAGFGRGEILRLDTMEIFFRDTTMLEEPVELAFVDDELVVLGNDTANIVVLDHDGRVARMFGYPQLRGGHDLAIEDGLVYVASDSNGDAIQVWDLARAAFVRSFGGRDLLASATGIAVEDGVVYACDYQLDRVVRFDGAGVTVSEIESPVSLALVGDRLDVLTKSGIAQLDRETLAARGHLELDWLSYPRGLTFVSE